MDDILRMAPVIPVLTLRNVEHAVPLARALVAGGLPVLEVTLRTDAALDAAAAMIRAVPEAVVGLGTLTRAEDFAQARRIGARFGVSPGFVRELAVAARAAGLPFLPGVATASEIIQARDLGFSRLKFFPAEPAGGIAALRSFAGPFPDVLFCPTGGIREDTAPTYLDLPNVVCVGGSWLVTEADLAAGAWADVTERARRMSGRAG